MEPTVILTVFIIGAVLGAVLAVVVIRMRVQSYLNGRDAYRHDITSAVDRLEQQGKNTR